MKLSNKYHKILSLFKRNMEGDKKFIIGEWTTPELEYLKDNQWIFTEKVDGTNIRIIWNGKDVVFGGRSDNAQIPTPLIMELDKLFKRMEPRQKLAEVFPQGLDRNLVSIDELNVVLYGEGYGARIQKGGGNYIPDGVSFVLFDVAINGLYLERNNVEDIANKLDLDIVPIIGQGTLDEAIEMTKKGFKSQWGDFIAEGIVARPKTEMRTRRGDRIITKVKYIDFQ